MTVAITPIGFVLLPLGLFLFLRSRRQLFWATVLSIPFFFAYVADLSITLVQPYQYFGALLVARHAVDLSVRGGERSFGISTPTAALCAFLFVIYLSLFMPAILQGSVYVTPSGTPYQEFENVEPLRFRMANVTQTIYPTFMVLLFLSLVREMRDLESVKNVVRLNVLASIVVIASGILFQMSMMVGGGPLVEAMFRVATGFTDLTRIFTSVRYNPIGVIPRMFTLVGEPGYTSSYLLFIFGIVVALNYNVVKRGWKLRHNRFAEGILLVGLLLAGSTTGYLGLVILFVVLMALPRVFRLGVKGYRFRSTLLVNVVLLFVIAALVIVAPVVAEMDFMDYVYRTHYSKLFEEAGSGSVRLATATTGVSVFLASPILGVGYGSHRTGSLLTSLLSNVGILGTLAFMVFNVLIIRRGVRVCRRSRRAELVSIAYALLVSLCTLLPVMLVGKSMIALVHGWYWLLLAMLEGCYRMHRREIHVTASSPVLREPEAVAESPAQA